MTNVSKNLLFAFAVFVSATVLSLGAFATTALAGDGDGYSFDGGGYSDYGGYSGYSDYGGYSGGYSDYGGYTGGYSDYGGYTGGYSDYGGYTGGYSDYGGYGGYSDYGGYTGGYSDYGGYSGYSDYGGAGTWEEYNPGYYEEYNPGSYETYNPGSYEEYNPGYYEEYSAGYVTEYMDQYAGGNPIFSGGSFGGGFSTGGGYSMPSFGSTGGCTTCHSTPSYPKPVPTPTCTNCNHPTPACTTCGGSNTNITNTNVNTNTWIDNSIIDNSINGSFNTNISNSGNTTILTPVVPQQQIVYQYQQQVAAPYCVITLQNAGVYTAQATLVWSSSNATTGYITSIGSVAPNGTRVVTGFANQTYSLTVTGQGGTYTCNTQPFIPTYVPPAPIAPSVSLTQIPYTGLALSPMAQAMYWLALLSVAAAGGYLLVYYKGGALALASVMNRRTSVSQNHFVVSEQEIAEVSAPEADETEEVAEAPVVDAMSFLPAMQAMKTRDIMSVVSSIDGAPRIVINRA